MQKRIIENFVTNHKITAFMVLTLLTIFITRLLTKFKGINLIIKGFELHHFYYGLILLIIISLIMLFEKGNFKLNLVLVAISIGLILDELIFIGTKIRGLINYNQTFSSILPLTIILLLIVQIIFYGLKKNEKTN